MSANYRFEEFELDIARGELRHRGERVNLEPRAFDVLAHLVTHRDRTVSVAELLEQVWGGAAVERGSVHRAIRLIRRTFNEIEPRIELIETAPRRGYRFVPDAQPFVPATREARSGEFVSRDDLVSEIERVVDRAVRGSCELILFHGPAGIGKSATLSELVRTANRRGADVFQGRSIEGTASPPYQPWLRVIRRALARDGVPDMIRGLGVHAAEVARAFPEVAVELGFPDVVEPRTERGSRIRVNDAIADWIRFRANRAPVALVFDDLHHADIDSILLLSYLVQDLHEVPVLLAGAYRDQADNVAALQTIERLVSLRPQASTRLVELSRSGVEQFARAKSTIDWSDEELGFLADASGGNPLFLEQLLARERNELVVARRGPRDARLQGVLRRLLDGASAPCREMLSFASVLGREFDPPVIAAGLEIDAIDVQDMIEEAVQLRILERMDEPGRARFIHGLIPEELYNALSSRQRAEHHMRAFDAILATRRGSRDQLSEIARHAHEAVDLIGFERSFEYAMEDARDAVQRLAFDDAILRFERARSLRPADLRATTRCLIELASVMVMSGRAGQARPLFIEACDNAREIGDPILFARAALGPMEIEEYMEALAEHTALVTEAVDMLGDADDALKIHLLEALTRTGYYQHRERCLRASEEALTIARELGEPSLICSSAVNRSEALGWTDRRDERRALAREANEIAGHHSVAARDRGTALRVAAREALAGADCATYRFHVNRIEEFAREHRFAYFDWTASVMRGTLAILEGRFRDARAVVDRQLELGRHSHPVLALQIATVHRSIMQIIGDDPSSFPETMEGLVAAFPEISPWRASLSLALAESGDPERALEMLHQLFASDFAPRHTDLFPICVAVSAQAAHRLGDFEAAQTVLAELDRVEDPYIVVGLGLAGYGASKRYRGLCHETLGQLDEAIRRYEGGIETDRAMEAWPFVAYGLNDLGRTLRMRANPGDREAADECCEQALRIANDLAIEGMIKRFESQSDR